MAVEDAIFPKKVCYRVFTNFTEEDLSRFRRFFSNVTNRMMRVTVMRSVCSTTRCLTCPKQVNKVKRRHNKMFISEVKSMLVFSSHRMQTPFVVERDRHDIQVMSVLAARLSIQWHSCLYFQDNLVCFIQGMSSHSEEYAVKKRVKRDARKRLETQKTQKQGNKE